MILSQAFSIYCDVFARDSSLKNNKIRTENASFENAYDLFNTVKVHHVDVSTEIYIENFVEEEDNGYLVYHSDAIEAPWEHVKQIGFDVSGVSMPDMFPMGPLPKFTALKHEKAIQVTISFCGDDNVLVVGRIRNLSGSMADVQHLIDTNQITMYYMNLGITWSTNGAPRDEYFDRQPAIFDYATFSVDKIMIAKHILQPALDCINMKKEASEGAKQLVTLAKVNPSHEALQRVAEEHRSLEYRNAMLKSSRDLLQTVQVSYPGIEQPIRFLLRDGMPYPTFSGEPGWMIDVPVEVEMSTTIPLSRINRLQFHLVNVPWTRRMISPWELQPQFSRDPVLIVKYSADVTGFFCFDDSLKGVDVPNFPGGFANFVRGVLHNNSPDLAELQNYSFLTMRLAKVLVRLKSIQHITDALDIDTKKEAASKEV